MHSKWLIGGWPPFKERTPNLSYCEAIDLSDKRVREMNALKAKYANTSSQRENIVDVRVATINELPADSILAALEMYDFRVALKALQNMQEIVCELNGEVDGWSGEVLCLNGEKLSSKANVSGLEDNVSCLEDDPSDHEQDSFG